MNIIDKIKQKFVSDIVEIYEITQSNKTYLYTSSDYKVTIDGKTYLPRTITRDNIKRDSNVFAGELTFTMPRNDDVSQIFKESFALPVFLKIYKADRKDPNIEKIMIYTGYINSASTNEDTTEFNCNTNEFFAENKILRYAFAERCQHQLYSSQCGVNIDNFKQSVTIASVSANQKVLTIEETIEPDFYAEGTAIFSTSYASIESNTDKEIVLVGSKESVKVGDTIDIAAGCDKKRETCRMKFNNYENFLGFENVPDRNPMDGQRL